MVIETMKDQNNNKVTDKMVRFAQKNGRLPEMYQPYNDTEITDTSPAITSHVGQGGWDSSSQIMICETSILLNETKLSKSEHERTFMSDKIEKVGQVTAVVDEPICLNSKGGRGGIPNLQPSLENRVYSSEGVSTALTTAFLPSIAEDDTERCIQTGELMINDLDRAKRVYSDEGLAGSLTVNINHDSKYEVKNEEPKVDTHLRIRKLTPKECYRLMGFEDKDYQACEDSGFGSSATYHTAGDSIVTTCLMGLLGTMLMPQEELSTLIQEYADTLAERTQR